MRNNWCKWPKAEVPAVADAAMVTDGGNFLRWHRERDHKRVYQRIDFISTGGRKAFTKELVQAHISFLSPMSNIRNLSRS